jgi:hypothetical protein
MPLSSRPLHSIPNSQCVKPTSNLEMERLARQWCQLVMDQLQEARSKQKLIRANSDKTIENRYRETKRDSALSRQEPLFASSGCPLPNNNIVLHEQPHCPERENICGQQTKKKKN